MQRRAMPNSMSNSNSNNSNELERLCRLGDWNGLLEQLSMNPASRNPQPPCIPIPDVCWNGHGATLLAQALVRRIHSSVPSLAVVRALVETNPEQLAVVHSVRGSVLHQAIALAVTAANNTRNHYDDETAEHSEHWEIVAYLLQEVIRYEQGRCEVSSSSAKSSSISPLLQQIQIQRGRRIAGPSILLATNEWGRTLLHQLALAVVPRQHPNRGILLLQVWNRILRLDDNVPDATSTTTMTEDTTGIRIPADILQQLLNQADADGHTALGLLMQQQQPPRNLPNSESLYNEHHDNNTNIVEAVVAEMLQWAPQTAWATRAQSLHRRCLPVHLAALAQGDDCGNNNSRRTSNSPTPGFLDGTPLYYAVLYGQSTAIVQRLLRAFESHTAALYRRGSSTATQASSLSLKSPPSRNSPICTRWEETLLHVAVTVGAPAATVACLARHDPAAVHAVDEDGWTPIDWLWLTYLRKWWSYFDNSNLQDDDDNNNNEDPQQQREQQAGRPGAADIRRVSRRRWLSPGLARWHTLATRQILSPSLLSLNIPLEDLNNWRSQLVDRLQILLSVVPVPQTCGSTASLLHAACSLPSCPMSVLVLLMQPSEETDKRSAASTHLHQAVTLPRWRRPNVSVGVPGMTQCVEDNEHPVRYILGTNESCLVRNEEGQLPLHVAIDHQLPWPMTTMDSSTLISSEEKLDYDDGVKSINLLLERHPEAISAQDGKTHLLPFQQAARGPTADLSTVFALLSRQPSLLWSRPVPVTGN